MSPASISGLFRRLSPSRPTKRRPPGIPGAVSFSVRFSESPRAASGNHGVMAHDTLGPAFWRIGRAAGAADPRPDADLVTAFVQSRSDAAFAELVARHGPVVLGTCRRILGDGPDADDGF